MNTSAERPSSGSTAPVAQSPPSLLWRLTSLTDRLDWNRLFPSHQPIEVELGSGDGGFLLAYAAQHPERNFLGIERLLGRLRKLDRRGRRQRLTNLRGLRVEAAYLVEYLFPPSSVDAIHVYFPDPWPKRRHWPRRLIQAPFAEHAWRALADNGRIYLRTDHPDYFRQMARVFQAHAGFRPCESPTELTDILTDFERDFLAQGIRTLHAAFQKQPDASLPACPSPSD